jgi:hypothetical protein
MNLRLVFCAILLTFFALSGQAQVNLTMSFEREGYLLYESIPIKITINNVGDQEVVLKNNAENVSEWISFNIFRADGTKVRTDNPISASPLSIPASEVQSLLVDLTPAYALRETGQYTIQAILSIPGRKPFITDARVFNIGKGDQIWSDERLESGSKRVYSLVKFLSQEDSHLYARVEEPANNMILSTQRLGRFTAFTNPVVKIDGSGFFHVVHTVSGQNYRYSLLDQSGGLLKQEDRLIQGSRPALVDKADGTVQFVGGTMIEEKKTRPKLSEGQQGLM